MHILENISCGLDAGTSSVGWGLIDTKARKIHPHTVAHRLWRDGASRKVVEERLAAGVIKFDPVEQKLQGKWISRSNERGVFRRSRNRLQRKQWRLEALRALFHELHMIETADASPVFQSKIKKFKSPWVLREEALHRTLSGEELFRALYHIAGHRVYEANSKAGEAAELAAIGDNADQKPVSKKGNSAESYGAKLTSLTAEIETSGLTVAQYFNANFTEEDGRKHGLNGGLDRLFKRKLLRDEVRRVFAAQRDHGNKCATAALEAEYDRIAFYIRAGQDSEKFVGECPFARDADGKPLKRAPRFSPSYEKFRFLQKLANLRLTDGGFLSSEQRNMVATSFGDRAAYTWAALGEVLDLDPTTAFKDAPKILERDFVMARGECARGTSILNDVLAGLDAAPGMLDHVAATLSYRPDIRSIEEGLRKSKLPAPIADRAIEAARTGAFKFFKGAGHISVSAAQQLSERLLAGDNYDRACAFYGWDHAAPQNSVFAGIARPASAKDVLKVINDPDNPPIQSPGARKALGAAFKQFVAITREFGGLPGSVHVELARDIGKSLEERTKADKGRKENESRNRKQDVLFEDVVGRPPIKGSEDMLRYRLWREQRHECPYRSSRDGVNGYISCEMFRKDRLGDGTLLNIDHILPWSWSHDDSFENLVLCFADENARKGSMVPWQYFGADPKRWEKFNGWINTIPTLKSTAERKKAKEADDDPGMGGYKRRNLLVEGDEAIAKLKDRLSTRHLNDTRYATRVLMQAITCLYPIEHHLDWDGKEIEKQRVFARPGQLVGMLRRAWGLNYLKFDSVGERLNDDRNHAVDALIGAAITNAGLKQMTEAYKAQEKEGGRKSRAISKFLPPWKGFAADVKAARDTVFVVRTERKRARGKLHDAGIFGGGPAAGKEDFHYRLNIQKEFGMKKNKFDADEARKQLANVKDRERNQHIINAIEAWIEAGAMREDGKWPTDQRGQPIRRITLIDPSRKPAIAVHDGDADRGKIVRIDIYTKPKTTKSGDGQDEWYTVPVLDRKSYPNPPTIYVCGVETNLDPDHRFKFSIYSRSYVEIHKNKKPMIAGYYMDFDRSVASIKIGRHHDLALVEKSTGTKTALTIVKYDVSAFGALSVISEEKITWGHQMT
jgi:CRISPR-associated endonuclease Csn1